MENFKANNEMNLMYPSPNFKNYFNFALLVLSILFLF